MFVQTEKSAADDHWIYRGKVFVTKGLELSKTQGITPGSPERCWPSGPARLGTYAHVG